jgi:hypothetical protein
MSDKKLIEKLEAENERLRKLLDSALFIAQRYDSDLFPGADAPLTKE